MKRAALERVRAMRIFRAHVVHHEPRRPEAGPAPTTETGGFRERRRVAVGGKSRGQLGHDSKVYGYPTLQEEKAWLEYQDQLEESGLSSLERHQRRRIRAMVTSKTD